MLDLGWSGRCKFSEEQHWPKNMKQFEGGGGDEGRVVASLAHTSDPSTRCGLQTKSKQSPLKNIIPQYFLSPEVLCGSAEGECGDPPAGF